MAVTNGALRKGRSAFVRRISILLGLLGSLGSAPAQAEIDWNPQRTWIFAVGLLEWQHASVYAPFPAAKLHRSDQQLVELFKASGIPEERIVYLQDQHATKRRIEHDFVEQLSRSKPGDLLIFYFAGHGARDTETHQTYFANYDAGQKWASHWAVREIFDTLEHHFKGDQAILTADCCHSGALYDEAQRRKSSLSYACLTSAYSHNSSTGSWAFTNSLLKGWRGNALVDANGDRQVTLKELAEYTELDMAFFVQQKAMFIATGNFDPNMRLAETRDKHVPGLGRRVEVESEGKWWPAQVIAIEGERSKIHYGGYGARWDEWVTAERMRPYAPQTWSKDTRVKVLWSGDNHWYSGTVMASWYGLHKVHYDGYPHEWDEWVGGKAIKLQKP